MVCPSAAIVSSVMNPPPMEKIGALVLNGAAGIERSDAQAIGMLRVRAGRKHCVAMEEEIARFFEWNGALTGQRDAMGLANGGDRGRDVGRINGRGFVAGETEQHGAIGSVAQAGECERAVQVGLHTLHVPQNSTLGQPARKTACGAHGAHGVRTRRTDADLVQVEETGRHA